MITAQYSDIVLGKVDSSDAGYNFKEMEITLTEHHHAGTVVQKLALSLTMMAQTFMAFS